MNRLDQQYEIIMYRDLKNPLCEYFNVNGIIFNFIPDHPQAPIIDQIIHQSNGKKILLIVDFATLKKLCDQQSVYHNFADITNRGQIKLIFFQNSDSLVDICNSLVYNENENNKMQDVLKDLKFIWWIDSLGGGQFIKQFRNAQVYELHHPQISFFNTHHFFHMRKEKQKTNTFFSLMRLREGNKRIHRNMLADKMRNSQYIKDAITIVNIAETKEIADLFFSDLAFNYGKKHLSQAIWTDSAPKIYLYEKTYFELVAETFGAIDGDDSFYITEKTLKPIMMGHPFIMLSTKHFLKNLRKLGFKTFADFIDESYDECDTVADRVEIISKNLERLDMDTSKQLYEGTKEIREHNQRHLLYLHGRYRFDIWEKWTNFFENFE